MTGFFNLLLGGRRRSPLRIPTDKIFPVHYFDDTDVNRNMIMCWTMRFNEVLDADALHVSLAKLLEIGDWRKLGGRIRLNVFHPIAVQFRSNNISLDERDLTGLYTGS
jgi:hypothetical protein